METELARLDRLEEEAWRRYDTAVQDFLGASAKGDAQAVMLWAPEVIDFSVKDGGAYRARRPARLYEVMMGAAECIDPHLRDVMQFVLDVSLGRAGQPQAQEMIRRMARQWGEMA